MKKRIFIILHNKFPSERAASLFTAKTAESFAREGREVTVIVPRRRGRDQSKAADYYGIEDNFSVQFLPTLDLFGVPILTRWAFPISYLAFSFFCLFFLKRNASKDDIIYSNEALPLFVASFFFKNIFYELHDFPERKLSIKFYSIFLKRASWILIHNKWKIKKAREIFKLPEEKILYQPNAVDVKAFDLGMKKEEARAALRIPRDMHMVVYTGHLYSWKGVDTLAESARFLDPDTRIFFIGGTDPDVEKFSQKYGLIENVSIMGYRSHTEIPLWQQAADVLVLPNTAKEDISKYYTSPMKLFEYMASDRPIVATNIPSITEILNEENAFLCEPDSPRSLASAIQKALKDTLVSNRFAIQARKDVEKFTWESRAKNILKHMKIV